jgi:hypothetical protein
MFHIEFDRHYRVVWARFSGTLVREDIIAFDRAATAFVVNEGCAHFVFDFTAVNSVALPEQAIVERGKRPHLCPGCERVVVAPQSEISGLYRLFAAKQSMIGSSVPKIVKTIEHAFLHLGVGRPNFKPVTTPQIASRRPDAVC